MTQVQAPERQKPAGPRRLNYAMLFAAGMGAGFALGLTAALLVASIARGTVMNVEAERAGARDQLAENMSEAFRDALWGDKDRPKEPGASDASEPSEPAARVEPVPLEPLQMTVDKFYAEYGSHSRRFGGPEKMLTDAQVAEAARLGVEESRGKEVTWRGVVTSVKADEGFMRSSKRHGYTVHVALKNGVWAVLACLPSQKASVLRLSEGDLVKFAATIEDHSGVQATLFAQYGNEFLWLGNGRILSITKRGE